MEHHKVTLPHRVDDSMAVWEEFKEVSIKYECVSLGEGAPGMNPPQFLVDAMIESIHEGFNQYIRIMGSPLLVNKIAEIYGKKIKREVNPLTEVIVGVGAYTLIGSILLALIDPNQNEEIIIFEPCWPCYYDHVQISNAVYRSVPFKLVDGVWRFDPEEFRKALNQKSKILLLNNAQNPTGKLFSREEYQQISDILKDFPNIIILSDEVYEYLTFDGSEFIHFATIDDNFNKTISVFSGGKLFNATGWKVGWALGPSYLVKAVATVLNTLVQGTNSPAQIAMSKSLEKLTQKGFLGNDDQTYLEYVRSEFQRVRDYMVKEINENMDLPIKALKCDSGYFIMVDITEVIPQIPKRYTESHDFEDLQEGLFMPDGRIPNDLAFCRWMVVERKVMMMPNSLFYYKDSLYKTDNYVRLAICKGYDLSVKAILRLQGKQYQ
ncbi:kynurenine-oxoglutarate transaminase [Stylonychia lemnae]|uniref:Kynurenine-oxoglutarate transaminase n=1 Tax=Stylonychia lemnae TaxID=5949 RepID=A0A078A0N1_STYLE|nr:kynurenine-oxoglutarate transaminase [Stylonychia lemnae]|eukprot:CDW75417.1 kynurenine-oxoglutarate transaminase [Stylonychia lemnae]